MIGILAKLQERRTGYKFFNGINDECAMAPMKESTSMYPDETEPSKYLEEFRLETSVGAGYRLSPSASDRDRRLAHKRARRIIAEVLFAEVHVAITQCQAAIWNGDKTAALDILEHLRNDITEPHETEI